MISVGEDDVVRKAPSKMTRAAVSIFRKPCKCRGLMCSQIAVGREQEIEGRIRRIAARERAQARRVGDGA